MTWRQSSQKYGRTYTQQQPRQRIQAICECCEISGHDIRTTGCDYAASFILTNDFLRKNQNMKKQILSKFKSYQKNRLDASKTRQSLSKRIESAAQDKRIRLSPQVKLLIEAIGDTVESDLHETDDEPTILHLTDIVDTTTVDEEFHETDDRSSSSSTEE